ncbi:MAG: LysM peptidoglycan-binding domain-containing M23 family metallopeptidase [Spirochaetia bacterium]|nr:LysM peptidoglycan-binding domain-containing M23 family metallopeptidase [Spirochaetia bacterium]
MVFPLAKNGLIFAKNSKKKIYYKIEKGDNLTIIAKKFNVSMDEIADWNKLSPKEVLLAGKTLLIYGVKSSHVLHPGEAIDLEKPVARWEIIKEYSPVGEYRNPGLLCRVIGENQVKPANAGTVLKISQIRGYGQYILIDHGNGWHSLYSNIEEVNVKSGQYVDSSHIIGRAKNNKLFFLLAYDGKPVNPTGYFNSKRD